MKRILFVLALMLVSKVVIAQPYNNEWIDYSKTYYKFKVAATGLCRINQPALAAAGLGSVPCEQFQLWRNGVQVPLFTSINTGLFNTNDFIEFWGQMNDGKIDKYLYNNPANQLSDKLSLVTDTAAYFLTVNTNTTNNIRYKFANNNVAGNTLPAETFFNHILRFNFKDKANRGYGENYGETVYSSTYDAAEILSTTDIEKGTGAYKIFFKNLYTYAGGGNATLNAGIAGNSNKIRSAKVSINGIDVINKSISNYSSSVFTNNTIPLSVFNNNLDSASISIVTNDDYDRIVASFLELQYARQFNFDGASNFEFSIVPSTAGNFLQINNFNNGGSLPVLYDAATLEYLIGDTSLAGTVRFALPSASNRNLVLTSRAVSNINFINSLQPKTFTNYTTTQGNYLIVSNKLLTSGTNPVEQYRSYRSSVAGGSYNAVVYDIEDLVDQFAYGIKKHPLSVRNFLRYAKANFTTAPKFIFLIGKGVTYNDYRFNQSKPDIEQQNLVPTFGWPASDAMLVSADNALPTPIVAFGRLSAITPDEVTTYLDKIKSYEQQPIITTQNINGKMWMKQLVHVVGGKNDGEDQTFTYYLKGYENIITDTVFGGVVKTFNKQSGNETSPVTQADMVNLFNKGIGLVTYFGHSAASGLAYNLNEPSDYSNTNKYPVFLVNGCTAGNVYDYDPVRASTLANVSEKWIFAKNRGSVGFIATTHFGLTGQLDVYSTGFYRSLGKNGYGKTIGENMMDALNYIKSVSFPGYLEKIHEEEFMLHGDPAIKIYNTTKPDFAIEDDKVIITPTFISVLDKQFTFKTAIYNLGKAVGDSLNVLVTRKYPNGTTEDIFNKKIIAVRSIDDTSVNLIIPIDALRDKGSNSITITVDNNNLYDEQSETNNSITKSFFIYEDELTPVYPANYSIINKSQIKFMATTANPLAAANNYSIELDTTALFNSSSKLTKTISSVGGVLEFDLNTTFANGQEYFWRVAPVSVTGNYRWNNSSFIYMQAATKGGYNQSHFYQHTESSLKNMSADTTKRIFDFTNQPQSLLIRNRVWQLKVESDADYSIAVNDAINPLVHGVLWRGQNITFTVYNPHTLQAMFNISPNAPSGQYSSLGYPASTTGREYDFAYSTTTKQGRDDARDFMTNTIPDGSYVVVRSIILDSTGIAGFPWPEPNYAADWKADQSVNGTGNTLYDKLTSAGFSDLDSFNRKRVFAFVYQKNGTTFKPVWNFSNGVSDLMSLKVYVNTKNGNGSMVSPKFGPAKKWYHMQWMGNRTNMQDSVNIKLIGIKNNNSIDTLQTFTEMQTNNDISTVDAAVYPYLQMVFNTSDTTNYTAYQLKYWRLIADYLPEGALAPNIKFNFSDTLEKGSTQNIALAFKNVSDVDYTDSLDVKLQITDINNVTKTIAVPKLKKLAVGDTATIYTSVNTNDLVGKNSFFVNVNPTNNPQEQSLLNNFAFKNFYVTDDNKNPVLDVTFDGIHILNRDIVSSKPSIRIALKDEAKYLLLNDTSLVTVQLRTPDLVVRQIKYDNDTLQFIPASNSQTNTAVVQFNPTLFEDGEYELIIKAKDRSNNQAGPQQYRVLFVVSNKPAISNVFNYPNPFTTSTAFVFTLTGSVVPQNIRIQILTVTGKVVKEITKAELGDLHIGRNITDYKWDGTDMYGQQLGNGVYLYRVITNNNGTSLDKIGTADATGRNIDTAKFFKAGYGKMYLMR